MQKEGTKKRVFCDIMKTEKNPEISKGVRTGKFIVRSRVMIDDTIRKSMRVNVEEVDSLVVKILGIAINDKSKNVKPTEVECLDISISGLKMASSLEFMVGIKLSLQISIDKKQMMINGRIVRRNREKDDFIYGVAFAPLSDFEKIVLNNYIKKKAIANIRELRSGN